MLIPYSLQVGRHELQLGEGGYREQERAGGSLGGKSTAWGGCLVSVFHFYSNHSLLNQIESMLIDTLRRLNN